MIRRGVALVLLLASCSASAFVDGSGSYNRPASADLSTYARNGSGESSDLRRLLDRPYKTQSGRTLPTKVLDTLKPSKANLSRHLARQLMRGGLAGLAAGVAADAFLNYLDNDGTRDGADGLPERLATAWQFRVGTSPTNGFVGPNGAVYTIGTAPRYQSWYEAGRDLVDATCTSVEANFPGTTCSPGAITLTSVTGSGNSRVFSATAAYSRSANGSTSNHTSSFSSVGSGLAGQVEDLTEDDLAERLEGRSGDSAPYESLLDAATVPGTDPYAVADGDTGSLDLEQKPVTSESYGSKTTTKPDGTTETVSKEDSVTAEPATGPAKDQKLKPKETTKTTTINEDGTTVEEEDVTPAERESLEVTVNASQCGAAGQAACQTIEQGTFNAPAGTLPVIPGAKTFEQSTTDFMAAINGSPLFSFVSSLSIPAGGACPTFPIVIDYLGFSGTFDSHCAIVDQIGPALASVMLAFWLLIAVRRVLSA